MTQSNKFLLSHRMDGTRKAATSAHQLEYKIKLIVRLSNWCVPNHLLSPKIWVLCLCEKEKGELGRFTINVIEWHNNGTAISYQFLVKRTINDIVYCCVFLFSLSRTKKHGCYDLSNYQTPSCSCYACFPLSSRPAPQTNILWEMGSKNIGSRKKRSNCDKSP